MIEEVVNSILEAEDIAQKRVEQAMQEANEIIAAAENEADNFKKQASATNKTFFVQECQRIEEQVAALAAQKLAQLNAETDEEVKQFESGVESAVKFILESL